MKTRGGKKKLWMVVAKDGNDIEVGTILAHNKPTPLQAQEVLGFSGGDWWIFEATLKPPVEIDDMAKLPKKTWPGTISSLAPQTWLTRFGKNS